MLLRVWKVIGCKQTSTLHDQFDHTILYIHQHAHVVIISCSIFHYTYTCTFLYMSCTHTYNTPTQSTCMGINQRYGYSCAFNKPQLTGRYSQQPIPGCFPGAFDICAYIYIQVIVKVYMYTVTSLTTSVLDGIIVIISLQTTCTLYSALYIQCTVQHNYTCTMYTIIVDYSIV